MTDIPLIWIAQGNPKENLESSSSNVGAVYRAADMSEKIYVMGNSSKSYDSGLPFPQSTLVLEALSEL